MNRSTSTKPPILMPPAKKTQEEIDAQLKDTEKVDAVSEIPLNNANAAANPEPEGKGRAKEKKPKEKAAPPAEKAIEMTYAWNEPGAELDKVFSTRIPAGLQSKMNYLCGLNKKKYKIGEMTTQALEDKIGEIFKQLGIKG